MLESLCKPTQGVITIAVSSLLLFVGATTVFAELQSDLDRIWRAPQKEQSSGIWGLLRSRLLLSFGMILGIGFLLIVSLIFSAALAALTKWLENFFGGWGILAYVLNILISFSLTTAAFAMIYKNYAKSKNRQA